MQSKPYPLLGGINLEDSEDSLQPGEVRDSSNFLFERKECLTRPGVTPVAITGGINGVPLFGQSFPLTGTPYTILITSTGKVYKLVGAAVTEITGVGTSFGAATYLNAAAVNGIVLIANNTGGLLRWDPAGVVYTVMVNAKLRFITSHLSRAIGAYDTNAAAGLAERTVKWSAAGDETDWTGASAGSAVISDAPDEFTGIGNLHNIVVLPRRTGFHLGFPTGISLPAFRFDTWSRDGAGCAFPDTWDVADNIAYCVGPDDVYTFDLSKLTPIGYNIRRELFSYINAGVPFWGFVSRTTGNASRLRYNLVPSGRVLGVNVPHFCYDILDSKWSKHSYSSTLWTGFNRVLNTTHESTMLIDSQSRLLEWDDSLACESDAFMLSGNTPLDEQEKDYTVRRVLLRSRDQGTQDVACTLTAQLDAVRQGDRQTKSIGSDVASTGWRRDWFDFEVAGQDFQFRIDVQAGNRFSANYYSLRYIESGEYKNAS